MNNPKNRVVRWLAVVMVVMVLPAVGALAIRLRPYWVAKYRGAGADLREALLIRAPLAGARLRAANLGSANLGGANLASAWLMEAHLQGANLRGANLKGAILAGVDARNANLQFADLFGATLINSDLRGADLRHTDLTRLCELVREGPPGSTSLAAVYYDAHTRWPAGFDPHMHGARLVK